MRVLAENQNLSQNLQVPALEEVITSNECISQDVPTEEVDTYFPLKIKYIILHSRSGKSHTVSLTVSNGTRCSLMILWCSKRWEGQIKVYSDSFGQVYVLLNENYVEDDDNMFRFDYR